MTLPASTTGVGLRLRRLATLAASTFLAVAPTLQAGPPPPQAATGTIKGRLIWDGGAIPAPKIAVKKGDPKITDPVCKANDILNKDLVVDPETKGIVDAFAYLVSPTGDYSATEKALVAKTPSVTIDQVACEYVPYASVVHKDQKLVFKSSDPVGHNVDFKPFGNPAINQMLIPNGSVPYPIKKAEKRPAAAVCSIHPWMKGWVFIVDNPFAVVTKADGSFEIKNVPAGEQHLVVWQSSKGYVTEGSGKGKAIVVKAGETLDVGDLKISK